jgi:molybdenum-dependent DNA-binding transcriptional regulator ModE
MMNVIQKLNKTRNSMNAHMDRGGRERSLRGQDLIMRYNDLKSEAEEQGVWAEYCKQQNAVESHFGGCLYA